MERHDPVLYTRPGWKILADVLLETGEALSMRANGAVDQFLR